MSAFDRDVLLASGRTGHVRAARTGDIDRLRRFYDDLSDTSAYYRFFGVRPFITAEELRSSTIVDIRRHVALLVECRGDLVGVGEYVLPPGATEAELAFAVADAHHGEGIATLLLEDLAVIARAGGLSGLVAHTLPGNEAMRTVLRTAGLHHRTRPGDRGTLRIDIDLADLDALRTCADRRDVEATVRSLRAFMRPSQIASIGSDPPDVVLASLASAPELVVIDARREDVSEIVERCGQAGVRGAVVLSGARRGLLATARRHGMRLIGPDSFGLVLPDVGLQPAAGPHLASGRTAICTQSRRASAAIAADTARRGVGVSAFVSLGAEIDVTTTDLLWWWSQDTATSTVIVDLERVVDPGELERVTAAVSAVKAVVLGGASAAPRRAHRRPADRRVGAMPLRTLRAQPPSSAGAPCSRAAAGTLAGGR